MKRTSKWAFLTCAGVTTVVGSIAGCSSPDAGGNAASTNGADGVANSSATTNGATSDATTGTSSVAAAPIKTVAPDAKVKVAFVTNNASDFWTIAKRGCEKADQELPNLTMEFKLPGEGTAAEQTRIVDDLLSAGVDGFAISPVDPANQTALLNKAASQVLVVTQDSDAPKSNRAAYIGTDNRAAGRQAGDLIKKALPNGGKIMVFVGKIDAQNAKERYEGIQESLKGSNVTIIDVRTDDTDRAKAKSNVADTLVQHADVAGLVGLWSYNGPAILNAVKDAGKIGEVKIICFDEEAETLAGVQSGAIYATVVQQPYKFGYEALKLMDKVLRGDTKAIPANKQVVVPTRAIDKSNVAAFTTEITKLRKG
ncbi:MAG: ribose transport system substrate-binding protein [Abditibacteriota bacterium]|nr:ribose transport system substrate-binding protein [Abditibacteriota bacterium]